MYADRQEFAICLDAATGKTLWETGIGESFLDSQGGDGPRATPAVSEGMAYFIGSLGRVCALDATTGRVVWTVDLIADLGGRLPSWGYCGSPRVEGGLLLLESGAEGGPSLHALDKKTGHPVWRSRPGRAGYTAPLVIEVQGGRQVVFFTADGPVGVALADGTPLWHYDWPTPWGINAATPVFIAPDKVFITSNYDLGAALLQIEHGRDRYRVTPAWKSTAMNAHFTTPVLHEGYLYGFDDAVLKCIDLTDGSERWRKRGFGKGSLIVAGGLLLILGERGVLTLARVDGDAFHSLGAVRVLGKPSWTMPALAGGYLYLRDQNKAVCLDWRAVPTAAP